MRYCPKCGTKSSGGNFCTECGFKLEYNNYENDYIREHNKERISMESFSYIDNNDGTYIITGIKNKYLLSLKIPACVIAIEESAFENCNFTSVTFSDGLQSIGKNAFHGCASISAIEFPNTLITIGESAFENCSKLETVLFPYSLLSIGVYAFKNCEMLEEYVVPDKTQVGFEAFSGTFKDLETKSNIMNGFEYASLGNGTLKIIKYIGNTNTQITIPTVVSVIGEAAFLNNPHIEKIIIPEGVVKIEKNAFYGCTALKEIVIPETVFTIGKFAFAQCTNLENIIIPRSVKQAGEGLFSKCRRLKKILFEDYSVTERWDPTWKIECKAKDYLIC